MISTEEMVLEVKPEDSQSSFKLGIVVALFENGTAQIMFDGETAASEKQYAYLDSYAPTMEDRVLLGVLGGTYVILGKVNYNVGPSSEVEIDRYLFDLKQVIMQKGLSVTLGLTTDTLTANGTTELKGGATITGALNAETATLTGNLSAIDVTASGKLAVTGTSTLSGTTTINGVTTINNSLSVRGVSTGSGYPSDLAGGIVVGNNATFSTGGSFTCNKSASFTDTTLLLGGTFGLNATTLSKAVSLTNTLAVAEKATFSKEVQINGPLNHDGTTVGFFGVTPVTRRSGTLYSKLSTSATLTDVINKVNAYIQVLNDIGIVSA